MPLQLERLKGDVSMRAQSSDAVTTLANLNTKIRSLKTETSDLKLRLEAIDKEKAAMLIEINELKKWKQEAEVKFILLNAT
jgi:regulator of replication initiation timing